MGKAHAPLLALNRGEVSRYSLARVDLERMRLSAEQQINWMPTVLGPMMLRPGTQHIGGINGDLTCRLLPFVFSNTDLGLLEFTNSNMRVWLVDGDTETLLSRVSVSTVVTNGDFGSSTGWTLVQTGAQASATISAGTLNLSSPAFGGLAQGKRVITVAGPDQAKEHAFRIVVTRGPIRFRAGTLDGEDNYVPECTLDTGTHSLAFTPQGANVFIQLETISATLKIVDSITIESAGAVTIPTSFTAADLPYIRYSQSGDIVFLACQGQRQKKIERRSTTSWSFVDYKTDDGPFQNANATNITLTPSEISLNILLTASRALFTTSHVGSLVRLFSSGQETDDLLAASDTYGAPVRVTGVGSDRQMIYSIVGIWIGTITLQRSITSADSGFADVSNYTGNTTVTLLDGLDNEIVWYRLGFKAGNYTSGTATVAQHYPSGGGAGICRITAFTSPTVVSVEVLKNFSSLVPTTDWSLGDWSDAVGWPSAVAFHDGRLWWAGRDRIWGSVSDAYNSFDPDYVGDAGPINRSVGFGPVDIINWLLPLTRMIVGRQGAETSIRSSAFDQPLTPTNFGLKDCSSQGSSAIGAVKIDTRGVFIQQSNRRAYELAFDVNSQDYGLHDLTRLNPDIGIPGFVDLAVQRQPDTQLHFIRSDGQVAALLHDVEDQVEAWWRVNSTGCSGVIESVAILPGALENRVYYSVKRTINGVTKRFLEKLARRDQCYGLPESRCADSHVIYSGAATTAITGLSHLEGQSVVVWGFNTVTPFTATLPDGTTATVGKDFGTFTVASGQVTGLSNAVTDACVGLGYSATFKSAKLAYAADMGTALTQKKTINRVGLILANTHNQGIEFGDNFSVMDGLPLVEEGAVTDTSTVWESYDQQMITVPRKWNTDSRLCLRGTAPRPCMVMAVVVDQTTHEN